MTQYPSRPDCLNLVQFIDLHSRAGLVDVVVFAFLDAGVVVVLEVVEVDDVDCRFLAPDFLESDFSSLPFNTFAFFFFLDSSTSGDGFCFL